MTKEQIENAKTGTPEERAAFSRLAGEVLGKAPYKHDRGDFGKEGDSGFDGWCMFCTKCKVKIWNAGQKIAGHYTDESKKPCSVADPIPLTWPEAMKWRDWAVGECGATAFRRAMYDVMHATDFDDFHAIPCLQPEHYEKAAMLCKIGKE